MSDTSLVVACLQLNSQQSVADNLHNTLRLAADAVQRHRAQWIVLPENAFCHPFDPAHQAELDRVLPELQQFCRDHSVWMFAGTLPVSANPVSENDSSGKVYSALHVINHFGKVVAVYRKTHLFDVYVAEADVEYRESDSFAAGDIPVVVDTPWGKVGLAICYDLRFPELFLAMEPEEPVAFVVPSAFTFHTGQRHWHTLLKARAIDTFTWVLAADQTGMKCNGRGTFGHTAIVSPDGVIVAELAEGEGCVVHTLDLNLPGKIRGQIPLAQHRKIQHRNIQFLGHPEKGVS